MRYLADILTLIRFILALVLFYLACTRVELYVGLLLFLAAELTDAFDGTCATKWPFPKDKTPRYRKYAAKYDMIADALLAFALVVFFTFRVDFVAGCIFFLVYTILGLIIEYVVYGKLFGHPDDCTKRSLIKRNFKKAKILILARRNFYLACLATVSTWILYTCEWPLAVKIVITVIAASVSLFLWFFLSQRRHNISRDAVEIEKELSTEKKPAAKKTATKKSTAKKVAAKKPAAKKPATKKKTTTKKKSTTKKKTSTKKSTK